MAHPLQKVYQDDGDYWIARATAKSMRISQKGIYALQALAFLGRRHGQGAIKIREIARTQDLPEKFLELILLELKHARIVESVRGSKGGYQLKRPASKIFLGEIIRTIDGPLAPFEDAESLRQLAEQDSDRSALFAVLLSVRNAAARILDHTSLADICGPRTHLHSLEEPRGSEGISLAGDYV